MRSPGSRSTAKMAIACCALLLGACARLPTSWLSGVPAQPTGPDDWTWVYVTLLIAGLSTALTGLAFIKFYALSRSLRTEIQARRALEDELKALAITDPGTEVMNRRGLFRAIEEALALGTSPLSLLIIDLDHFKTVNDTHGHACGDHVLREFARICHEIVRESDAVGRLGGEEFAIVLPGTGPDEARRMAERIRAAVERRAIPLPKGGSIEVTVSVGLAVHRPDESLEGLMSRADGAMYEAKCLGRNRVVVAATFDQTARLQQLRDRKRCKSRYPERRAATASRSCKATSP
jgi:diguanylate cyclase (GGDEF)-like protein